MGTIEIKNDTGNLINDPMEVDNQLNNFFVETPLQILNWKKWNAGRDSNSLVQSSNGWIVSRTFDVPYQWLSTYPIFPGLLKTQKLIPF